MQNTQAWGANDLAPNSWIPFQGLGNSFLSGLPHGQICLAQSRQLGESEDIHAHPTATFIGWLVLGLLVKDTCKGISYLSEASSNDQFPKAN